MSKNTGIDTDKDGYISAKEYLSEVESLLDLEEPVGDFTSIYSPNFGITFLLKCIKYFNGPMKKIACIPLISECRYLKKDCINNEIYKKIDWRKPVERFYGMKILSNAGLRLSSRCLKYEYPPYTPANCEDINDQGDLLIHSDDINGRFRIEDTIKNTDIGENICEKQSRNNKFLGCLFPFTSRYSNISNNKDKLVIRGPFDNLSYIISNCKKKGLELVIFSLGLYRNTVITSTESHANCLIINILQKTIERFDPHGGDGEAVYNQKLIDDSLKKIFSMELKDYTYINYYESCPYFGPQTLEANSEYAHGLCVTWTTLYIVLRILNPKKSQDFIVKKMMEGTPYHILSTLLRFQAFMINVIKLYSEPENLSDYLSEDEDKDEDKDIPLKDTDVLVEGGKKHKNIFRVKKTKNQKKKSRKKSRKTNKNK
jgi:hypothetical protein